ncbi:hypothetical protein F3Y22_tig00110391pilonHSYRG00230 [Hibiscus syriacus]|uniref:beta-galactosidase n=1 Tax=Hibiscus syriacus TaxID=106335 RepID=A0A6A3APU7_HIBSY|nr:hypothetical protein F3Y22_tig00110391pilonHSYRG00230 [Hibiscus syriacus]
MNVPGRVNMSVTYDEQSLIFNGRRALVFWGAIHYPRSPPEYWEDLIVKSKRGGLNAIEMYVFWNGHEPEQGNFNFEGEYDLVKFIKLIAKQKMSAINHMKLVTINVDKLKAEKLFASQGGPIIVAQINSCNGRHCGDTFTGPNKPNKPYLWTENWTEQYRVFGDPPSQRSAEDLAFSVVQCTMVAQTMAERGLLSFNKRTEIWSYQGRSNLFYGSPTVVKLSPEIEAQMWQQPGTPNCAAFLANNATAKPATVSFRGGEYYLPPKSIGVLPDCKTMVLNTQLGSKIEKNFVYQKDAKFETGKNAVLLGYFYAPEGTNPVAIRLIGMSKGMVCINGKSIGRYWMSDLSILKEPTQSEYHIPKTFLKPTKNLIVILEKDGANPKDIEIVVINRDTICTQGRPKVSGREEDRHRRVCQLRDPFGSCGSHSIGNCTSPNSKQVVEKLCLGKPSCQIPVDKKQFDNQNGACPDLKKKLAVQVFILSNSFLDDYPSLLTQTHTRVYREVHGNEPDGFQPDPIGSG